MVPISQYQSARCCSATMTFSELCSFPCIRFIYFTFVFVFGWSDPTKTLTWFTLTMYAKLNSCNTNQIWEICMFSRLHTQSMQSCHFEKKTLITGNGAFAMSLQKKHVFVSRGAFCLRMFRRKYFDVSNSWYAPALRVRK